MLTQMNRSVEACVQLVGSYNISVHSRTNKRKSHGQQSDAPRNTILFPSTLILKRSKHKGCRALRSQIDQWDQQGKEKEYMADTSDTLNVWQNSDPKYV